MTKRYITIFILLLASTLFSFAQFRSAEFSATGVFKDVDADKVTNLEKVYIFKDLTGATISYTTSASNMVKVYTYKTSMTTDPKEVTDTTQTPVGKDRRKYTISILEDGTGVAFVDNNQTKAVWVIDYSLNRPKLHQITPIESEDKCQTLKLLIDKDDILQYRGTNGLVREIDREYQLEYKIQSWKGDQFIEENHLMKKSGIGTELLLDRVPNIDTNFTLTGDQFGIEFGIPAEIEFKGYKATAVEAHMIYKRLNEEEAKENNENSDIQGSAPIEVDFYGHANEPTANHFSWYVFNKNDLKNPIARYNDLDMKNYTFDKSGNFLVRFEVANTLSGCVDSTSINVQVFESDLKVANYFSPRRSPGVNDVFRVKCTSIVRFKCTIFNRWGNKIYEWSDPSGGWDGTYKGKLVNPGVYFYVIQATGSDGIKWDRGGDINIL